MTPLLEQFLSEARDFLQGIGEKLMQLEEDPSNQELMTALFRMVHTLKGNSGLFEFREMTRVLHAGEDLMDAVRQGRVQYSKTLADRLLDAMDFVGLLCEEIEAQGCVASKHATDSARLAESLRQLLASEIGTDGEARSGSAQADQLSAPSGMEDATDILARFAALPESVRTDACRRGRDAGVLTWLDYTPGEQCFFEGDDPFHQARGTPDLLWGSITARHAWPPLAELDVYSCALDFHLLSAAPVAELDEHFRYVADQVRRVPLDLALLQGDGSAPPVVAATALRRATNLPDHRADALAAIVTAQREILSLPADARGQSGCIKAAAAALSGCLRASGEMSALPALEAALASALLLDAPAPLLAWLDGWFGAASTAASTTCAATQNSNGLARQDGADGVAESAAERTPGAARRAPDPDGEPKFGRRADDAAGVSRTLKVDQVKIDRLMNLIGEMVVSKNALPYLADRAETVFGVRDLSREIKAQYGVINRIAEEMQDAIMQVRMMPVSFVFQRFPRLVRDTSRKLGKDVNLVLEGEETEADKNIIESLGDPLVHILRNSLDHGFELPEVRVAAGKAAMGTLTIRASQESDRVVIEVRDDGQGIDPDVIKRKALERGLIDEAMFGRISDKEAVNLVFASGFSTMEVVSDLSGRGVGMDVVRTAVEKVNGTVSLDSEKGNGTCIRLSLPLSMAVTNVMIVESNGQAFGVPMDSVVETVRVPRTAVSAIKDQLATVLRGRIVPLKAINALLGLGDPPSVNADGEFAVLVVRIGDEAVGLMVDQFRESVEIILKPMTGVLAGLTAYAGSALLGDGSVLMVLNVREMF